MRKIYTLVLLFLPLLSIAQSNYKSGYVVNLKGDTLRGFINLKSWAHNPESISFKTSENDKPQQLGFSEISYFQVYSYAAYTKYKVALSLNKIDITSPTTLVDTSTTSAYIF